MRKLGNFVFSQPNPLSEHVAIALTGFAGVPLWCIQHATPSCVEVVKVGDHNVLHFLAIRAGKMPTRIVLVPAHVRRILGLYLSQQPAGERSWLLPTQRGVKLYRLSIRRILADLFPVRTMELERCRSWYKYFIRINCNSTYRLILGKMRSASMTPERELKMQQHLDEVFARWWQGALPPLVTYKPGEERV